MKLYDATELYPNFEYPAGIHKVVELGLVDLDWWWIPEASFAGDCARGMARARSSTTSRTPAGSCARRRPAANARR